MKKLYLIKNARSGWDQPGLGDIERGLTEKGRQEIKTIGSYLRLRGITPDVILSSCAYRAQETADLLAKEIEYVGEKHYLMELYMTPPERILEILAAQDEDSELIFLIAHSPQIHEFANTLMAEHISRFPALGIVAIDLEIEHWSEIGPKRGKLDFFIYPQQFEYYLPNQIRAELAMRESSIDS
jgi:phosphohistidine phosphatase